MRLLLSFVIISFFATPWQLVNSMAKMTILPMKQITIAGKTGADIHVSFVYTRKTDIMRWKEGDEETELKAQSIPPWLRLFLVQPQERKETTDFLMRTLQSLGIDTSKKMLSREESTGKDLYIIGRNAPSDSGPFLALYKQDFLPYRLYYASTEITFGNYHASPFPLAFPGLVSIKKDTIETTYFFPRKDGQNDQKN